MKIPGIPYPHAVRRLLFNHVKEYIQIRSRDDINVFERTSTRLHCVQLYMVVQSRCSVRTTCVQNISYITVQTIFISPTQILVSETNVFEQHSNGLILFFKNISNTVHRLVLVML